MKAKYRFVAALLAAVAFGAVLFVRLYGDGRPQKEDGRIRVAASFYPIYIAAKNIVGDCPGIELVSLSEPQAGCLHDYVLTPADMKLMSTADLLLANGGGMESFLTDVAAQYPQLVITETADVLPDENAHVWMSVKRYRTQVAAIADALYETAGENLKTLQSNAREYDAKLAELEAQQEEIRTAAAGRNIVSFHEAYEYLAEDYGLSIAYTLDLDEERQVGAGEVADVLNVIWEDEADILLAEETYGSEMAAVVQMEADVKVCFLDTLVRGDYEPDSYIKGMQRNIDCLKEAFGVE